MFKRRKVNAKSDSRSSASRCDEKCVATSDSETTVDIVVSDNNEDSDNSEDSGDSDPIVPVRKHVRRSEVREENDDEDENTSHQLAEPWIWRETDNEPNIWRYSETPGVKASVLCQLGKTPSILDVFYVIFDSKFWEMLLTGTNCYAQQAINDESKRRKADESWVPVTCDEVKAFYALCVLMTQVRKPSIQLYWSKRTVIETPIFRKVMPFGRFRQISRFLHLARDNAQADNADRLRKVKPVIDLWNEKFKEIYTLEENITVHESLMKFREHLSRFSSPRKRARFNVRVHKLCESSTGFCHRFKMHTEQDEIEAADGAPEIVTMELSRSVLNRGHTLFLDNWHSSPNLVSALIKNKTNVIGTVRSNRRNMPGDVVSKKLQKGEYATRSGNGLLVVKWKDKRDMYIISTKHERVEMTEQAGAKFEKTLKPNCVIEHSNGMAGADRQAQMLACFPIMRKVMKGYRKLFFYMFDMALFNTYILYKKVHGEEKQTYADYRINVAEWLLKTTLPDYRRGRPSQGDTPLRLQAQHWAHFPKHIDATPLKKNPTRLCKVCTKNKKRSETTWECTKCQVALHVPHCFQRYHTVEDY